MPSTKATILLFLFFVSISSFSQQTRTATFGKPTHQELTMTSYEKDLEASGVVLYEKGNNYIKYTSGYIYIYKEVHKKTKVIDANNFDHSTIDIYLYRNGSSKEKITKLKAITHNGNLQTYVKSDAIFEIDKTENWSLHRFTFPNIKDGSVLEYSYTIRTPYFFNFGDWSYQGDLPKIYSEFNSEIPGNFVYDRVVYGKLPLFIDEATVKRKCFSLPSFTNPADCEVARYVMKDIPAFKEENYMLAKSNYISRVDYDLRSFYDFNGINNNYSKSWKDVEKEFKYDKGMGRQLNNNSYFKKEIPGHILTITDDLEKAKSIYTFIQKHFTWDGNSSVFSNARVKKAFEKKSGSSSEINLSLINALQAADLDAKLVLHSTRENGVPVASYPIITDFNYVLVLLTINEKEYLLDATEKYNPFGIVPFRALNLRGRVMDFKKGSYWFPVMPNKRNVSYFSAQLIFEDELISGKISEISTGYKAIEKREEINNKSENEYILSKEEISPELEITNFTVENSYDLDKPVKEMYSINYSLEEISDKIYLSPYFLQSEFNENPFKSDERSFPIDFGYPLSSTYILTIDLNNKYEVEELPKNKMIALAEGEGECKVFYDYKDGKINLRYTFKLNEHHFGADEYLDLKEFFNQLVEILTKDTIVLKKI